MLNPTFPEAQHPMFYRCNGRLIFCLCRTCATECNANGENAYETDGERALTGTWVIYEVSMTVQKSYEIVEFIEVYE